MLIVTPSDRLHSVLSSLFGPSNNILTADSGILYLTLELAFYSDTAWVEIGGVRLTLEHD